MGLYTGPTETFEIETPERYTVTFNTDASLAITADCNRAAGSYQGEGGKLTVEIGPVTAAACPPESRSEQFLKLLGGGAQYFFRDGNLYRPVCRWRHDNLRPGVRRIRDANDR